MQTLAALQKRRGGVSLGTVAGFADATVYLPVPPIVSNPVADGLVYVDYWTYVWTGTAWIWAEVRAYKQQWLMNISPSITAQKIPTQIIQVSPGLQNHAVYGFFTMQQAPTQYIGVAMGADQSAAGVTTWKINASQTFDGYFSGEVSFWLNKGVVSRIPISIYTGNTSKTNSTVFFDAAQSGGLTLNGRGGGLSVFTPLDAQTRNIPSVNVSGDIDEIRVDGQFFYQTVASPGQIYFAVLSS